MLLAQMLGVNSFFLNHTNLKLGSDILIAGPIHLLCLCDPVAASAKLLLKTSTKLASETRC
jgi:hypothetical protein